MSEWEIILKLILSCILGGMIGLERESLNRPAGLRTYTLVCMGSALAMVVSLEMYYQFQATVNADPGRIAAQVVSGIGFIGAGTIIREGPTIRGLTTAAGIWVVGCIGLAVGAGMYIPAVATSILVLFILIYFRRLEERVSRMRDYRGFSMIVEDIPGQVGRIGSAVGDLGVSIKNIQLSETDEPGRIEVELLVVLPQNLDPETVIRSLSNVAGVFSVEQIG
ncbi:MAG: MgtC/SapB family protein [Syntrophomonadaceae bacterium]|nr:MgtC/SapB family protein [Syntrophomonadaceae bacterium]